ncbi:MAG: DUF2309 domain-containing protein [Planctomycetia bacterium]
METTDRLEEIRRAIERAAGYLPTQGPIGVFVAQNILQGFEGTPFEDAVVEAAGLYGTEPFLPESRYREELASGRIRVADLEAVLDDELGDRGDDHLAGGRVRLRTLLLALLQHPVRQEDDVAVRWTLTESDAVERDEIEDLWHSCVEAVSLIRAPVFGRRPPVRFRDLFVALDPEVDTDALVHAFLIRVCAAFLDQGVAAWPMPGRERGLLAAVVDLYSGPIGPTEPWTARLPAALSAIRGKSAGDVILDELRLLGIPPEHQEEFVVSSILALRGWAGMIRQFEQRPDRAPVEAVPARLEDFLALRLLLDRLAAQWIAPRFGRADDLAGLWTELRDRFPPRRGAGSVARAYLLFQAAQLVGLSAHDIRVLDENQLMQFEATIHAFGAVRRRRLFHLAYERRHRVETLDALAAHERHACPPPSDRPRAQLVFCMDERCESFRRHFEEIEPACETFGAAGFFAVPMYYRGIDDWHATPLCPIVMRPSHTVVEVPEAAALSDHEFRQRVRRQLGQLVGSVSSGSRTLFRGGLFTAVGGALAAVPLVARVAFPRATAAIFKKARSLAQRRIPTRLAIERVEEAPLPDGTRAGFSVDEMAGMVRRLLEDIGLTTRFSRLVVVIGHASTSLNNPHESAYDCGACGGGRGGPNARAFALMANDPRVRRVLAGAGLEIPADTVFVGAMQDTCSDALEFFDVPLLPADNRAEFQRIVAACDEARRCDAHERCRRFDSVPLDVEPQEALARVEGRASDLAQVRPEYGHATNAVCVIGRRWRTRGLFLDRRAFLVSYDPAADGDGAILARTLAAVGPVGSGINLAYMFSCIDPRGYGCGTKLPHNITGLIGVMDGHASDLRTGLPWQTVEIHEPVRLLIVIDAPQDRILAAVESLPVVKRLVENRWVQVAAWHPDGGGIAVFDRGKFVPFECGVDRIAIVENSRAWYSGHRGNLPPARILAGLATADGETVPA